MLFGQVSIGFFLGFLLPAMAKQHSIKGYEGFLQFIKEYQSDGKIINVLFSGEKDEKARGNKHIIKLLPFNISFYLRVLPGVLTVWKLNRLSKRR